MKGVVVIPCWQRSEWLAVCLHHIQQAKGWKEYHYILMVDRGYTDEVMQVAESFPAPSKEVYTHRHSYRGNSYNVLEGYRKAYEWLMVNGGGYCHLIEEDIFICQGYFHFHEEAWRLDPQAFFVSACYNQNLPEQPQGDESMVFLHQSYQSLGVSLSMKSLEAILPHNTPIYLRNMSNYVQMKIPSILHKQWCEQDGLIYRLVLKADSYGLFPCVPRAFHAGFKGYNRPGKELEKSKSLALRTRELLEMTEAEMNERAMNPAHKDIRRSRSDYFEPQILKLVP